MGADEQVRGSVDEAAVRDDADRTAEVPTMSFDDAKKALGEDVKKSSLDEQPTRKMGALSADDAEKITGERRAVRVFKHPSKPPPPRLELPLATAQFQAVDEESLRHIPAPASEPSPPSRPRSRGPITAAALLLSAAAGAGLAWATHDASAGTTRNAPPSATQPAEEPTSAVSPEPPAEASGRAEATEPETSQEAPPPEQAQGNAETAGPERAESLLETAENLRGGERLAALQAASSADPSNPHAAAALAEFHMENNPHEALEYALQAAQLRRRRASYQDLVADAYERIGNLNDAAHARATAASLREGGD